MGLGLSPYAPRVGSLPGGITAAYGSPMLPHEWTFRWTGYMSASLQASIHQRERTADGQSDTVLHALPSTVDEYASFLSTNTVPGHWVAMNFIYGNERVSATVGLTTYNPSEPTTYYQLGSQQFISNMFLTFSPEPIAGIRAHWMVGVFANNYGGLGQYGGGMYANSIVGGPRGAGETLTVEYDLSETLVATLEHGIMGMRTGTVPRAVVPSLENGYANPAWPADWVSHVHVGATLKGDPEIRAQAHYLHNWSQDDTTQLTVDDPLTRQIDETHILDADLYVYGLDISINSPTWGYLGAGVAYIEGEHAYALRSLTTYGGTGDQLTDRWWGGSTGGTGTLLVAGINYAVSLGKIVSYPTPFPGDGPDLTINAGFHIATTSTEYEPFDGRVRHKYGLDVMYTFLRYLGVGGRVDRVVPNSKDSEETFHVLSARLQFRTDWNSRELITLRYAKWLYGGRTHSDGMGARQIDRLDDQLVALNFGMWW
jgi:hypothetical protein